MPKLKLTLAYDGTDFSGWARQPGRRTVEGALLDVIERVAGMRPKISVAGRTDAGVHAMGQVCSFECELDPRRLQDALNGRLAPEVVVLDARLAPPDFDARRSATAREYRYRLHVGPFPDPFRARFEWHVPVHLDLTAMRAGARALIGEHDFASFCRTPKDGGSTVRRLERLTISRQGDRMEIRVRANAFLHQMVRSVVGTLVAVGEGRISSEAIPRILSERDRQAAGPVAPPHGLVLEAVVYGVSGRARR